MMSKPEQKLQIQVANYIQLRYPKLLWTISPVGLIISRTLGMLAVRMGYRSGTPDLIIFEPRGKFHGLFIELKWGDNTTSEEQNKFIQDALDRGYATAVCWTYEEATKTLDNYLNIGGDGEKQYTG
jgi:hypothetical protein